MFPTPEQQIAKHLAALQDPDPGLRRGAVEAFSFGDRLSEVPGAVEILRELITDPDEEVRAAVVQAMGHNPEVFGDYTFLLRTFQHESSRQVKLALGGVLGFCLQRQMTPDDALEIFMSLDPLQDADILQTFTSLFLFQKKWFQKSPVAQKYITELFLSDASPKLRLQALYILAKGLPFRNEFVIQAIREAQEDEDPEIRSTGNWYYELWLELDGRMSSFTE